MTCFLIGPAPYIGTPRLWLTLVADGTLGVGVALTIAPIYSAMMQVARPQCPDLSTESITMFISGLVPSALSFGELIGPLVGGGLNGIQDFQTSTSLFGEVTLAMAVLMLVVTLVDIRGKERKELSCRNVITFALCLLVYLCCNVALALFPPFFPLEAAVKGATSGIIGAVASANPLCVVITSPIFGYYLPRLGVKFTLLAGILLLGGSCVLFATLQWISGTTFVVFCFLFALVGGVGSSMMQTATYALAGMLFNGNYGVATGLLEVAAGLGYMAGPPVGGALYDLGGFLLPFLVVGAVPLSILPILCIIIKPTGFKEDQLPISTILRVLRSFVIISLVLSTVVGTSTLSFLIPIYSPFLYTQFDLSVYKIGLVSLIDAATYVGLCLVTAPLYDRLPPRPFIITGLVLCSLGCFLIGPAPYIGTPHLWLTLVADGILGVGVALTVAPSYSAMMQASRLQCAELSTDSIAMFISGVIPAAISCGEFIGPLVGGAAKEVFDFEQCASLFGEVSLAMAVLLFLVTAYDTCNTRARPKTQPSYTVESTPQDPAILHS
ncbi:hypothetical protein EMCRGX_G024874 [Ephydatia muelleri]